MIIFPLFFAIFTLTLFPTKSLAAISLPAWPSANGTDETVTATIKIEAGKTVNYYNKRFVADPSALGDGGNSESQKAVFELAEGATLQNVILGKPAADGIHCLGSCTLQNVWWEDVGEDAATFFGTSSSTVCTVNGGGAKNAADKVFQHDGSGKVSIKNFQVETFGTLYASCGNCAEQYKREVELDTVKAAAGSSDPWGIVGVNGNYDDQATLTNVEVPSTVDVTCAVWESGTSGSPQVKGYYAPGDTEWHTFNGGDPALASHCTLSGVIVAD